MSEPSRGGAVRAGRPRADVPQALLRPGFGHLYPGIPVGEWHPASVMVNLVLSNRPGAPLVSGTDRDRVLDEKHFQFRGLPSAGSQDDKRRTRLEDRQDRRRDSV
jgi:hypothetical protein